MAPQKRLPTTSLGFWVLSGEGGGGGRKGYMPHSKVSGFSKNAGVANGTSKNVGLGKFGQDLEISEAFLILDQKLR